MLFFYNYKVALKLFLMPKIDSFKIHRFDDKILERTVFMTTELFLIFALATILNIRNISNCVLAPVTMPLKN